MYAPSRSSTFAAESGHTVPASVAEARENFRPVALPALAAAVHVNTAAGKVTGARAQTRTPLRFVHEDQPID